MARPEIGTLRRYAQPGTGLSLGKVADSGPEDIDAAVAAAKAAFKEWRQVLPLERAKILRRIAQILRENANELAMIDAADCGNPVREMVSDAMVAAAQMEFFAGLVTEMKGASIPMGPDVVNFSVREPLGVVGLIIPFNHPLMFCVFANVNMSMRIAREEIFGPVLGVFKWNNEAKMLAEVNQVEYGLTASIWTNDLSTAHRTAMAVEAGFVWINEVGKHFLGAPFGGFKQSGLGREECFEEMLSFTQEKNIHVRLKPVKA
jgi:acyl-CoA reductase-like NAD-dependent aldehyde dehydrogenase